MTDIELQNYVNMRNHELCRDEIKAILDVDDNPSIKSFKYENGWYNVYTDRNIELYFQKKKLVKIS